MEGFLGQIVTISKSNFIIPIYTFDSTSAALSSEKINVIISENTHIIFFAFDSINQQQLRLLYLPICDHIGFKFSFGKFAQ